VAVTWIAGRPGASSLVVAHGWRPRALPPSPAGPGDGGEDGAGRREQGPAGGVEVVAVVVVAEQDRVDRSQVGGGDRRAGQLS
jgi:hypothetical protein